MCCCENCCYGSGRKIQKFLNMRSLAKMSGVAFCISAKTSVCKGLLCSFARPSRPFPSLEDLITVFILRQRVLRRGVPLTWSLSRSFLYLRKLFPSYLEPNTSAKLLPCIPTTKREEHRSINDVPLQFVVYTSVVL
jgi:hypothetical protein